MMQPYYEAPDLTLYCGSALDALHELPSTSVQTCITSPPFFGLRDYGTATWEGGHDECDHAVPATGSTQNRGNNGATGAPMRARCTLCDAVRIDQQIGLEATLGEYLDKLVAVFAEVMRVLRPDGLLWVECGDSYAGSGKGGNPIGSPWKGFMGSALRERAAQPKVFRPGSDGSTEGRTRRYSAVRNRDGSGPVPSFRPKQLMLVPHRLAIALGDAGWLLRQTNIWVRPNPMPESVTDRTTTAHTYVFQFARSERYFYDADAIAEPSSDPESYAGFHRGVATDALEDSGDAGYDGHRTRMGLKALKQSGKAYPLRNRRSVWTIPTQPFPDSHFATFPTALVTPLMLCSSRPGDTVLDCFSGSGTTGLVARQLNRNAVLIELSERYCAMSVKRLEGQTLALPLEARS